MCDNMAERADDKKQKNGGWILGEFQDEFRMHFGMKVGWCVFPVVSMKCLDRHVLDFSSLGGLLHFAPPNGQVSWMVLAGWQNQENMGETEGPKKSPRIHSKFTAKFIPKFTQNSPPNSQPNFACRSQNSPEIHCADISAQQFIVPQLRKKRPARRLRTADPGRFGATVPQTRCGRFGLANDLAQLLHSLGWRAILAQQFRKLDNG